MRSAFGLLVLLATACAPEESLPSVEDSVEGRLEDADGLRRSGLHDEALARYAELRRELEGSTDRHSVWRAVFGWASVQLTRGQHDLALRELPAIRAAAVGDPELESRSAYFAAAILHRQGDLEAALEEAQLARDKARAAGLEPLELDCMGMLATVHSLAGRHREALDIGEAIVARLRSTAPGSKALGEQLNELGIDYRRLGRYDDAVRAYEEALELHRRWSNERWEAVTLYNLANVVVDQGELERAVELKLDSLAIARRREDSYGLGLVHADLAMHYSSLGDETRARRHAQRALEINRQAKLAMGEISSLAALAQIDLVVGRADLAEPTLREALALAERGGYGSWRVAARSVLALCLVELGRGEEALDLAETALERAREQENPSLEIEALEARARALEALGRPAAPAAYLEAIELLESWRGRLVLGDLRLGLAEPRWQIYDGAIRVLLAADRSVEAYEVSERARARLLLELMAERDTSRPASSEWSALAAELRLLHAQRRGATSRRAEEIDREITRHIAALEAFEETRAVQRPWVPKPLPYDAIVSRLVTEDRALLSFFWGEEEVYGFFVTVDGLRVRALGSGDDLRPALEFLRSLLQEPEAEVDWRPVAVRLYRRLVHPFDAQRVKSLLIVPDGPLALVPFETLLQDHGSPPLGVTHRISYAPSASVLARLAASVPSPSESASMLALGFGGEPLSAWKRMLFGADRQAAETVWLRHAEPEAREVVELFGSDSQALTGRRASLESWLQHEPERRRYLHFATHASVSDRQPEKTQLALHGPGLDLRTIRSLDLAAELVTLSGCETALGREVRGEGLVGLSHAFLGAGARSVLVSQWKVDDLDSRRFMRSFYTRLRSGSSVADALRESREVLWREGNTPPFRWAAFVLVGAGWSGATVPGAE